MSKAYDKIKLDFLEEVLTKMRFLTILIKSIMNCVTSVLNTMGTYFLSVFRCPVHILNKVKGIIARI